MKGKQFLLLLSVIFVQAVDSASYSKREEGLKELEAKAPVQVQNIWSSTFGIQFETNNQFKFGTSSLIKIIQKELTTELFFLTSDHVIKEHCLENLKCPGGQLIQNMEIILEGNNATSSEKKGISFSEFEIVKRSAVPDVAVIKVTIPKDLTINFPAPIKISKDCHPKMRTKLFLVGFSNSTERVVEGTKPISNRNSIHKRWSSGLFIRLLPGMENGLAKVNLATTIDALPGGSGGPAINERGEIVGILESVDGAHGSYRYIGNETRGKEDYESLLVGCDVLNHFLADILEEPLCS
jgi:hypothetical protein